VEALDHLVYVAPDLEAAIDELESRLGVRAVHGGAHPGRGTRNALLALGARSYLEILAPDPQQPAPASSRWLGVDGPGLPRIVSWAVATSDLEAHIAEASRRGLVLGAVTSGSRMRPDGATLRWRLTDPIPLIADGLVPFFIDWGDGPHPAETAPTGVTLVALRAEHPDVESVRDLLDAASIELEVTAGERAALVATLDTPRGRVELR
jgi:hypothetical protein